MTLILKILCSCFCGIGLLLGTSYQDLSVFICIYVYPLICILCSLLVPLLTFKVLDFFSPFSKIWVTINIVISFFYMMFTSKIWEHFSLFETPDLDKFKLWQININKIAEYMDMSYTEVNIYIYGYLFLVIIAFHTLPSLIAILYRHIKKVKKEKQNTEMAITTINN